MQTSGSKYGLSFGKLLRTLCGKFNLKNSWILSLGATNCHLFFPCRSCLPWNTLQHQQEFVQLQRRLIGSGIRLNWGTILLEKHCKSATIVTIIIMILYPIGISSRNNLYWESTWPWHRNPVFLLLDWLNTQCARCNIYISIQCITMHKYTHIFDLRAYCTHRLLHLGAEASSFCSWAD